jgi:hypothetical protein
MSIKDKVGEATALRMFKVQRLESFRTLNFEP